MLVTLRWLSRALWALALLLNAVAFGVAVARGSIAGTILHATLVGLLVWVSKDEDF